MTHIVSNNAPDNLKVFAALCMARATRWQIGDISDIGEAVDWLEEYSRVRGLARQYGVDAIQRIMWEAFMQVRDDIVNPHDRWAP